VARSVALAAVVVSLAAVGVVIGVARHDRAVAADANAQLERYDAALRHAAVADPRFEVAYVELNLAALQRYSRRPYHLVDDPVTRRIESGRPSLHPDVARLVRARTDATARAFAERRKPVYRGR